MSYFFPFEDIKQSVLLTLRFIFSHPLKQWPKGKKGGKAEIQNFNISRTKTAFQMTFLKAILIVI